MQICNMNDWVIIIRARFQWLCACIHTYVAIEFGKLTQEVPITVYALS